MPTLAQRVSLREITGETVRSVIELEVGEDQQDFVAPNAVSLAEALFAPEAWYRAIYLDDAPVGFVMLADETRLDAAPPTPGISVWRFMIDAQHQGLGIGREALVQVIALVRARRLFRTLELTYVPGPGCPEPFYLALGFRHTGRIDDGEVVLELPLEVPLEGEGN